jgi:UDP-N-acetylglucosamine:LPS N-acetylglucosamine transferase
VAQTILAVLAGGGHTAEMLALVGQLGRKYVYEYLLADNDPFSAQKIKYLGRVFRILNPYDYQTHDHSYLIAALKMCVTALQSVIFLARSRASIVISCGGVIAIAPVLISKIIFRKRLIYVESESRVKQLSWTGRFVYPFADLFIVQWPELCKQLPRAIYAGRIM